MDKDLKNFYAYGSEWERTFFDEKTGGFLVTELSRKYRPMSKNDKETFQKEQEMAIQYASFGFQIEHLNEIPGFSSPDARIKRLGISLIVSGRTADFKRLSSGNNIYKEGKDVRFKKKADLVLFEFTSHFDGIKRALEKLSDKRIQGYFFYSAEKKYYAF